MKNQNNCILCRNFFEPDEICKLANQRPPARVIAYGCPSFNPVDYSLTEEIPESTQPNDSTAPRFNVHMDKFVGKFNDPIVDGYNDNIPF